MASSSLASESACLGEQVNHRLALHLKTHAPAQCCHRKKTRTTVGAINHPITTQFRRRSNTASRQIGDHPRYGPPAKEPMPIGSVRCPFASSFLFLLRLSNTYPPRNILGTVFPPHLQLIPSHHHHCRISHSSSPIINHHQSLIINPHSHHQSPIILSAIILSAITNHPSSILTRIITLLCPCESHPVLTYCPCD